MRFELTRRNRHYPLKVACLPIPPPGQKKLTGSTVNIRRAKNGTRTRDPNLGKVVLYQLSYFRIIYCCDFLTSFAHFLAKVGNLIYSLGQGCALPTELFSHIYQKRLSHQLCSFPCQGWKPYLFLGARLCSTN